jgi:hypothetical protein
MCMDFTCFCNVLKKVPQDRSLATTCIGSWDLLGLGGELLLTTV